MIRLNQVAMPISHSEEALEKKIRKLLRLNSQEPIAYEIERRSLDARKPEEKVFRYTLDVTVKNEKRILKKFTIIILCQSIKGVIIFHTVEKSI